MSCGWGGKASGLKLGWALLVAAALAQAEAQGAGGIHVAGGNPYGRLLQASDGLLYGVTDHGGHEDGGTVFRVRPDGTGYTVLWSFGSIPSDGSNPRGGLVEGSDGALYGIARGGGLMGAGAIFRITRDGSRYTLLRSLGLTPDDGRSPSGHLLAGSEGTLYGTTQNGGKTNAGVIFKVARDGSDYAILHSFGDGPGDGRVPAAHLIEGRDGMLYGTTFRGGSADRGTVFRLNKDGSSYALLRSFANSGGDGTNSTSGLVEGLDGMLYGTTQLGGTANGGTVFKLGKDGSDYAVLRSLVPASGQGRVLEAGLLQGADGRLYGVAASGGGLANAGTLFQLDTNGGNFTVLHVFGDNPGDGWTPRSGLMLGTNGVIYGVTHSGGNGKVGTIFRINPDGTDYAQLCQFHLGSIRVSVARSAQGAARITFPTEAGATYRVEWTVDLQPPITWQPLPGAEAVAGSGADALVVDAIASSGPRRFYRVLLTP
jgi:uncharacterized repeat protein (TIGR03803 family)